MVELMSKEIVILCVIELLKILNFFPILLRIYFSLSWGYLFTKHLEAKMNYQYTKEVKEVWKIEKMSCAILGVSQILIFYLILGNIH